MIGKLLEDPPDGPEILLLLLHRAVGYGRVVCIAGLNSLLKRRIKVCRGEFDFLLRWSGRMQSALGSGAVELKRGLDTTGYRQHVQRFLSAV